MTKTLTGILTGAALLLGGGAVAESPDTAAMDSTHSTTSLKSEATKSSAEMKPESAPVQSATGTELTGKVIRVDAKTIYVDHMGLVVPLKVNSSTTFSDPAIKRAKDLKEGQDIRANYMVKKTDNWATRVSLDSDAINSGQGGSGMVDHNGMLPKRDLNPDRGIKSAPDIDSSKTQDLKTGGPHDTVIPEPRDSRSPNTMP